VFQGGGHNPTHLSTKRARPGNSRISRGPRALGAEARGDSTKNRTPSEILPLPPLSPCASSCPSTPPQHLADFLVSALPVNLDGQLKLHKAYETLPFKVRPVGPAGDGKTED